LHTVARYGESRAAATVRRQRADGSVVTSDRSTVSIPAQIGKPDASRDRDRPPVPQPIVRKNSVQRSRSRPGNNLVTAAQVGDNSREAGGMKHLLVVEPDAILGQRVLARCERIARATLCRDFLSARSQLLASTPDLLVTNLRLEEYNGLHLVLLATAEGVTRSLVHTDRPDPYLVREAQAIGAFFERTERLLHAVVGYLQVDLPQRDRRNSDRYDRRTAFRGGRRAADITLPA
jgi:hypothetical protein